MCALCVVTGDLTGQFVRNRPHFNLYYCGRIINILCTPLHWVPALTHHPNESKPIQIKQMVIYASCDFFNCKIMIIGRQR